MAAQQSISATNLAVYHHLNCDLYIHNVYHKHTQSTTPEGVVRTDAQLLVESQYQRGMNWEATLYSWLDEENLLLKVPARPLEADVLLENILADEREHFFIAGVTFYPPQAFLQSSFDRAGTPPINFGISKPDLIEITRDHRGITWKVIDAKASKAIKTSHHAQVYFYTLCLAHLLPKPLFRPSGLGGIWLPPDEGFNVEPPSMDDIKSIDISLLQRSLDTLLFERLPKLLSLPRESVQWHFNPLCQGCKYNPECRSTAVDEGRLGSMPNVTISDARTLQEMVNLAEQTIPNFHRASTDIEDLHEVISRPETLSTLEHRYPIVVKKGKRILNIGRKKVLDKQSPVESPILESARSKSVTVIPRRNFTCPSREDIAIVLSLVQDPSTPKPQVESFTISLFERHSSQAIQRFSGEGSELIQTIAVIIRDLTGREGSAPTAQFYVWSSAEQALLQTHLIKHALVTDEGRSDVRQCIGALSQGASLLQTAFQPVLLSGALLTFLAKGKRLKAEYQACLDRMGLSTTGTVPELRARVVAELERLQGLEAEAAKKGDKDPEFGQIPRVVVLKKEIESMLAVPIAGYWDLRECAEALLGHDFTGSRFPTDEAVLKAFKSDGEGELGDFLNARNLIIFAVLEEARERLTENGQQLLVNEGKRITTDFMDMCREPHLSKLFFMQQFEVLSKLNELWSARMEGSPDAPILQYRGASAGSRGVEHAFTVLSGVVDVPASDKEISFFDKLLVEDTTSSTEVPLEALFDDLAISGYVIPLNRWTKPHWESQHPRVKQGVLLADLSNVQSLDGKIVVVLRAWGTATRDILVPGQKYRLSPRFIDFNTTKILSTLFEMDIRWENREGEVCADVSEGDGHRGVPFLQMVIDPRSFGRVPKAKEGLSIEDQTQRMFRELKGLGTAAAGNLLLKPSQHRATQRLLANRLAVIWGPPGTGKTHTLALSILRLLEVQWRLGDKGQKIIFLTAMTHAAIDACQSKLERLIAAYREVPGLQLDWLDAIRIERVMRGSDHPAPRRLCSLTQVYAGTLYQLYNFSKSHSIEVDCVIADEAGQIALASLALVLRNLSPSGRIIIAGDSEQLAPIFTGSYPRLKTAPLFGSVLDCVMFSQGDGPVVRTESQTESQETETTGSGRGTVIQLTENFRLNPDLGEFVATIYSHQFKPQKVQSRKLALSLRDVEHMGGKNQDTDVDPHVFEQMRSFLLGLSDVMLRKPQSALTAPRFQTNVPLPELEVMTDPTHQPVSLSLVRLKTWSSAGEQFGYETHVHGEAAVAAALVKALRRCAPEDDIFVATPHRVQREAVKSALARLKHSESSMVERLERLTVSQSEDPMKNVTVDTVERLQGSEASFVICLFSLPDVHSADLGFLLGRRRLNVAISRAKNLCILVTSSPVLCPPVTVFANEETAKGYAFLKAYEDRAWSYDVSVNIADI